MKMCLCCGNVETKNFRVLEHSNDEMILCIAEKECIIIEDGKPISSVVEIDDMLVDTIRVLRQNNFETLFCCQGHYLGYGGTFTGDIGYISFKIDQNDKEDFKKYQLLIDNIPDMIDNFVMSYEIVSGPLGPDMLSRSIIVDKLIIRFELAKNVEILTQLDFLEQNIQLHKKLFCLIYDLIEDMEEEKYQDSLLDEEKSIKYPRLK